LSPNERLIGFRSGLVIFHRHLRALRAVNVKQHRLDAQ
jgi:hypothetical protein